MMSRKTAMSLEWHEQCFDNRMASHLRLLKRLDALKLEIDESQASLEVYAKQIEEAKRLGKKSFDSDKFMSSLKRTVRIL